MSKVTIGMPIYNNEKTLRRAIDSILIQTEQDFTIILADDGSSDQSWEICKEYEKKDLRIVAHRHPQNLYYRNFYFLVKESESPFFCWLAGDDYLGERFLELCLAELDSHENCVGCATQCIFFDEENGTSSLAKDTFTIDADSSVMRLLNYFSRVEDNTRMYGVFRRHVLDKSFPDGIFHAYDWALSALTLCYGCHKEVQQISMYRDKTHPSSYNKMVSRDHKSIVLRCFPVLYMSFYLLKQPIFPKRKEVIYALIWINVKKHRSYVSSEHPSCAKILAPLFRFYDSWIEWRINPRRFI